MDNIYDLVKKLYELYEVLYLDLVDDVSYIIKKNIRNTKFIENTLDNLLNVPTDKAYNLFITLCNYYMTIDKEAALNYIDIYQELYGEEKPKIKKKDYKN